jgi:hypothetical protein
MNIVLGAERIMAIVLSLRRYLLVFSSLGTIRCDDNFMAAGTYRSALNARLWNLFSFSNCMELATEMLEPSKVQLPKCSSIEACSGIMGFRYSHFMVEIASQTAVGDDEERMKMVLHGKFLPIIRYS